MTTLIADSGSTKTDWALVDDAGQIHVKWENGSSLALLYDEDDFEIINEKTIEKAFERKIKYIEK